MMASPSLREFGEHDRDVPICFISNLGWLAPEGYVVDAMGFLVKPVAYGQFCRLMRRVLARLEYRRSRLISVRVGKMERLVDAHHLVYAESFKKHSLLHLLDEDIACTESLRALEEKCIGASMFRVHNAILINLEYVEGVTATDVIVQGKRLPLSRHRRQGLLGALAAFVGGDAVGGHSVAGRVPANGLTAGGRRMITSRLLLYTDAAWWLVSLAEFCVFLLFVRPLRLRREGRMAIVLNAIYFIAWHGIHLLHLDFVFDFCLNVALLSAYLLNNEVLYIGSRNLRCLYLLPVYGDGQDSVC